MSLQSLRQSRPSRIKRFSSLPLLIIGAALIGFLAQFQWIGDIIIVIAAVVAIIRRWPARIMFVAALWTLGIVPIAVIFSNWVVAQNFAAYCFLLLVIGVILAVIELKREPQSTA